MKVLTTAQQDQLTFWIEGMHTPPSTSTDLRYRDVYGNPVLDIKDTPPCMACNAAQTRECEVCDGYGTMHRLRQYTVLPSGGLTPPLGGASRMVELTSSEKAEWLEGVMKM